MMLTLSQVLLNAFSRALKDSFPPARVAALRALAATQKHYSPEEAACRALPAVTPLCVDGLPGRRSTACDVSQGRECICVEMSDCVCVTQCVCVWVTVRVCVLQRVQDDLPAALSGL
jgi:hypothetical protein